MSRSGASSCAMTESRVPTTVLCRNVLGGKTAVSFWTLVMALSKISGQGTRRCSCKGKCDTREVRLHQSWPPLQLSVPQTTADSSFHSSPSFGATARSLIDPSLGRAARCAAAAHSARTLALLLALALLLILTLAPLGRANV